MTDASPTVAELLDAAEVEIVPDIMPGKNDYPFVQGDDAKLRAFVFDSMCSADIEGAMMIKNMQRCFDWIKTGVVHVEEPRTRKAHLKEVPKE